MGGQNVKSPIVEAYVKCIILDVYPYWISDLFNQHNLYQQQC